MQEIINSWGSLIDVTGGALRPDKSCYYLVYYVWKRDTWIATEPDIDLDLIATDMKNKDEWQEISDVWKGKQKGEAQLK